MNWTINWKEEKRKQKITSHLPCYSTIDDIATGCPMAKWIKLKWYQPCTRWLDDDTVLVDQSSIREQREKAKSNIALNMFAKNDVFRIKWLIEKRKVRKIFTI